MDIQLVSQDSELCRLCREVLAELSDRLPMSVAGSDNTGCNADFYIFDFEPELQIPHTLRQNRSRCLFLVDRKDLPGFHNQVDDDANILLKPIFRRTLAIFLEHALTGSGSLPSLLLRLQEYDRERTNFLSRAAHDFRAPLTALSGYCGLLVDNSLGAIETQREVLHRMQNSIQRLTRMASAMSLMSAGAPVKARPLLQRGDLGARLDQSLHEIAPIADEKHISITPEMDPCDDLYFEPDQIEQVFVNLLDNACRFTARSGSIEIRGYRYFWERRSPGCSILPAADRRRRAGREPNSYRVDVRDSGAPIPEDNLQRIFEEYTSFAGGHSRSGGGLGLAICRTILSQHEGKIWAENTEPGPMFSFVLPLHRAGVPPAVKGNGAKLQLVEIGAH
jgi:signal transduction histidine kinase